MMSHSLTSDDPLLDKLKQLRHI